MLTNKLKHHRIVSKNNNTGKYFIETYGCQMNVADTELVQAMLENLGYSLTTDLSSANIIFINTCAIRDHAEKKVNSQLGRYRLIKKNKPDTIIGVLGCMAQSLKHDILENKPYVDLVIGPDSYRRLPEILERKNFQKNVVDTQLSRFEVYEDLFPNRKDGINAWISIMRGCDKFCTFCIVPFTRGRERSRPLASIIAEAKQAIIDGFPEITLLGQNVNSYKNGYHNFENLLFELSKLPGLKRIRFTSPHPSDMSDGVIDVISQNKNICNYVHLPLQAGSDRILKRMNRNYTRVQFIKLAKRIRSAIPNVGISTDIIVGFPGETDKEFKETLEVMKEVKFDSAYNFIYSPRKGTKAAEYEDYIGENEKKKRLQDVINLQKLHTLERNKSLIGTFQEVIIEKESKMSPNQWAGRTDSNKWVIFDKKHLNIGESVLVKIEKAVGLSLKGTIQL